MKRTKLYLGLGIVIAALATFGVPLPWGVAGAQAPTKTQAPSAQTAPAGPHPTRLMGKVSSISSNSLVLTTRQGDVTINVGANTWVVVEKDGKPSQGTLSDIQTGKPATVAGMTTGDPKVVDARVVAQARFIGAIAGRSLDKHKEMARKFLGEHGAMGTVKAINGNTITLTNERGQDVTVTTTADTVVFNNGFQNVSSVKVGDTVQVLGRPEKAAQGANGTPGTTTPAARTLNAWALRAQSAGTQLVIGHVDSVNDNTVTLKTPRNRDGMTVTLDNSTGYKALTVADKQVSLQSATQADVKADSNLVVEGATSADGKNLTAKAVVILPSRDKVTVKP